jgi:competence ComEA-like helix-hairpin-helix protein
MKRNGSILVGVLWCMVLLSVLVIGVLHTARMDLLVVKNYGDRVQAHYLALAGVERAKALLYQDVVTRQQTGKNHTGSLYDDSKDFKDVPLGRGKFRVFHRATQENGGGIVYGVTDEESRLNINVATANELTNFTGITSDIIGAIMTWRSGSTQDPSTQGGANSEYYMSLRPPYMARNAPFQTVRELLMVRGVTSDLLLGNDQNQNGFLDVDNPSDREFDSALLPLPPKPGWAASLTVSDTDKDVDASGKDRVNPQTADQGALSAIPGITQEIAQAIVSYRGRNQLTTLDDLLSVTAGNQNQGNGNNPQNSSNNSGAPVISQDLLEQVADQLTFANGDQQGLVNINTAGIDVLTCLPGVNRTLAQAIINYRSSTGYFANVAEVLKVDGMTRSVFKQIAPLITARSETYRIICEGKINSSGVVQRIESIVHIGRTDMETLGYREDL